MITYDFINDIQVLLSKVRTDFNWSNRGVAWIFEVVRRILIVCDWTVTGRRPVRDAAGDARGWSGGGGGGVAPPPEEKKLDL